MGNIVFYFSGTGNCLHAAKTIAKELGDTAIVSMAKPGNYSLEKQYDTIGFVYPTYFWGLPKRVIGFIENMSIKNNENAYYYSIAAYGGYCGNAVYQLYELLQKKHGVRLNFGQKLHMVPNYVVMYNISNKTKEITEKSDAKLISLINSIKNREKNKIGKLTKPFALFNRSFVKRVAGMDKYFTVNDNCTGCGICREVCPAKNIEIKDNRPHYNHNCEQCVACIHFCPQKAIDYKNSTQNRRRYTNPDVSYRELSERNNA